MKSTIRQSRPAAASRGAPTLAPDTSPASEPSKVLSIYGQFLKDVAAIFAGKVSSPEEIYTPVTQMDVRDVIQIGVLRSLMGREFLSLSMKLKEQSLHLPMPRSADQVHAHLETVSELTSLASKASELAWLCVKDEFPKQANRSSLAILDGWLVVRKPDLEDSLRGEASRRELTSEDVETFVARRLNQKHAEEQWVSFDQVEGSGGHGRRQHPREMLNELEALIGGGSR